MIKHGFSEIVKRIKIEEPFERIVTAKESEDKTISVYTYPDMTGCNYSRSSGKPEKHTGAAEFTEELFIRILTIENEADVESFVSDNPQFRFIKQEEPLLLSETMLEEIVMSVDGVRENYVLWLEFNNMEDIVPYLATHYSLKYTIDKHFLATAQNLWESMSRPDETDEEANEKYRSSAFALRMNIGYALKQTIIDLSKKYDKNETCETLFDALWLYLYKKVFIEKNGIENILELD